MKYWRKPLDDGKIRLPYAEIRVIQERCKGCNYCIEYCPRNVLSVGLEFNSKGYHPPVARSEDDCATCGLCEMLCPEFAIYCIEHECLEYEHLEHEHEYQPGPEVSDRSV